jgi:hypothetical protein
MSAPRSFAVIFSGVSFGFLSRTPCICCTLAALVSVMPVTSSCRDALAIALVELHLVASLPYTK